MRRYLVLATTALAGVLAIVLESSREDAGNMILGGISVASWVFVAVYWARSDWRATMAGRAIMRLVMCIGFLCTQGVLTILTDYSYPARDWIRPGLLLLILITLVDMFVILRRIQRGEIAIRTTTVETGGSNG